MNNLLPDVLTRFAQDERVTPAVFQRFAQNLLGYVDQERQAGVLAENLVERFKNKENEKEIIFSSFD